MQTQEIGTEVPYVPKDISFNWDTCEHFKDYEKEVETGEYKNWTLDMPYFKWEDDLLIAGDSHIDPETKELYVRKLPPDDKWYSFEKKCNLMYSSNWVSFGKTAKEAEEALESEIISILTKYPRMTLVVSKSVMDVWAPTYHTGKSDCGFAAGFTGGFVENPQIVTIGITAKAVNKEA